MESDQFAFADQYDWENRQLIAKGGFGKVFRVKNKKTEQLVAIKQMPMQLFDADYKVKALNLQIQSTKQIRSPYVVELIKYNIGKNYTYLILQLCENSLKGLLQTKILIQQKQAINIINDIVIGYQSLLKSNYIHRDIKPANILVKNNAYKLTDFGFATRIKSEIQKLSQICGTPLYMAPQLMYSKEYTSKCDVWSLGLVFYEMLFGCSPWATSYYDTYQKDVVSREVAFPYDYRIGQNTKDFISRCLQLEEDDRISWKQIFQHPLIKNKEAGKTVTYPTVSLRNQRILQKIQKSSSMQYINARKLFKKYESTKPLDEKGFHQFLIILDPQITSYQTKQIFDAADFSKDGHINIDEFKKIYIEIDYRPSNDVATKRIDQVAKIAKTKKMTTQQLFKQIDMNKSADIDYNQFQTFIKKIVPDIEVRQIQLMWSKFDKDKSGQVSLTQFITQIMYGMVPFQKVDFKNYQRASRNLNSLRNFFKAKNITAQILFQNKPNKQNPMSINQFGSFVRSINYVITRDQIIQMFRLIDVNNSDELELPELRKIISDHF